MSQSLRQWNKVNKSVASQKPQHHELRLRDNLFKRDATLNSSTITPLDKTHKNVE